jgi:TonB family protein
MAPAQPRTTPSFPAPTNFSLGQRKPEKHSTTRQTSRGRSTLDISLTMRDGDTGTVMNGRGGADWGNELVAWVNRHKYYPPQAAMQGEDGEVTARVVVNPNGHVTSVDLTMRSGSQWLDMALVALFRDRDVPPPPDKSEPTIVNFTMRYILIRQ